jgi:uncharacterized protein (DUF697 family)/GTP-binding protein EngB required for normal cell division
MTTSLVSAGEINRHWELAARDVEEALRGAVALAFVGSASSGKDSAIRALFGVDFGQIDPVPGSTERVRVAPIGAGDGLLIVNTPGFGDVRAEVDRAARHVLDQVDAFLYVLNCDGGATADERRDLAAVRAFRRPTLVCLNKIDLIRPHERENFVRQTLAQLGAEPEQSVVCAFDPLPALADEPIGVDAVLAWVQEALGDAKGLLVAKHARNRAAACDALIRTAARRAAAAGAVPLPGVDAAAVTAIQVRLVLDVAQVYGHPATRDVALFIVGEVMMSAGRGFARWAVAAAQAAGWIPGGQVMLVATSALGATISGASTYGVGRAAVAYMERQGKVTAPELRDVFDAEAGSWRDRQG